jgi:hypothetical protein
MALCFEDLETENHIIDRDGAAVVPPGLLPEVEGDPGAILRHFNALGKEPVFRKGLVRRVGKKGVVEAPKAHRRDAFEGEGVQIVKGPNGIETYISPFWGVWVDVFKMTEKGAIFGFPMHSDAVKRENCFCLNPRGTEKEHSQK